MKLKFTKLSDYAITPAYQTSGASGFDFQSTEKVTISPGETKLISTGIAVAVPEGFELQVRPRSGLSAKTGLRVVNSPGTCDADYRGEIKVILQNTGTLPYTINISDRIAQGVICPVIKVEFEEVEELEQTERGECGFGSTGK